ncbi:MAG: hypothetical protein IJP62_04230 [Treponema sp.]|nr:hypothetical protein [Treponema sp.]
MLDCKRIYADYSEKVYAYLRKHVSDAEAAADLHSKIFQKIVEHVDSYRGNPDAVSSFVYTVTKNCVIDFYRTRKFFDCIDDINYTVVQVVHPPRRSFFPSKCSKALPVRLRRFL